MHSASGKCGENLTWRLEDETLIISGEGPMENFQYRVEHNHWTANFDAYSISPWLYRDERNTIIRKVIIEEGVTSIGKNAFGSTDIVWHDHEGNFLHYSNQHLYLESVSIANSVTSIEDGAFCHCTALRELNLPTSLRTIGDHAFSNCTALKKIVLPDLLYAIGSYAFFRCTLLEKVTVPQSVCEIGTGAFDETPFLSHLKRKKGIVMLGKCAFLYRGAASRVKIPKGTQMIGACLFEKCGQLAEVEIPYGVKRIGFSAFKGCKNLQSITLPESIEEIGVFAFQKCENLSQVRMNPETIAFSRWTFDDTPWWKQQCGSVISKDRLVKYLGNEYSYTVPLNVSKIASWAIECTTLQELVIPQSVENVEGAACMGCANLTVLRLPESLHMFSPNAKAIVSCPAVKQIHYGDEKQYSVDGIQALGCAGENVVWVMQNDNTIIFLGNGTVDLSLLVGYDEEEYTDVGSYREYYYVWGREWSGKIVICKGVELTEPFPSKLPSQSMIDEDGYADIHTKHYCFTVCHEE